MSDLDFSLIYHFLHVPEERHASISVRSHCCDKVLVLLNALVDFQTRNLATVCDFTQVQKTIECAAAGMHGFWLLVRAYLFFRSSLFRERIVFTTTSVQ